MVSSFNPRPCARGDAVRAGRHFGELSVSIRAPARGATPSRDGYRVTLAWFQSAPLREGRRHAPSVDF